jgi:hypothetical protein
MSFFKLTGVPSGFVYASVTAENPTEINYTITFTGTGCTVTSYDAIGTAVADSTETGTTHALETGVYLTASCTG